MDSICGFLFVVFGSQCRFFNRHPVLYSAHWFGVGSASRFLWTPRTVYTGLELAHPVDIALSGLVIGRSGGGREVVVGLGEGEEGGWGVQANFGQFSIGGGGRGGGPAHNPK
jgi:hypothetical protein